MATQPPTVTYGPPTSQWLYSPATKTYDLTRGKSSKSFVVKTTEGPEEAWVRVAPELCALVVVDMQNYFLSGRCRQHPLGLAAIEPTIRVIRKCREVGIQIIFLNWGLTPSDLSTLPASILKGFSKPTSTTTTPSGLGIDLGSGKGKTLCTGSWNADIYPELKEWVREEDVHCAKNRMSGLWCESQPLWRYLDGKEEGEKGGKEGKRKETLFFAGVNTDQCVLGTLCDAYNAGWDCVMINDCCATTTEYGKEVCVYNVSRNYGFVVDSSTFCAGELS